MGALLGQEVESLDDVRWKSRVHRTGEEETLTSRGEVPTGSGVEVDVRFSFTRTPSRPTTPLGWVGVRCSSLSNNRTAY